MDKTPTKKNMSASVLERLRQKARENKDSKRWWNSAWLTAE